MESQISAADFVEQVFVEDAVEDDPKEYVILLRLQGLGDSPELFGLRVGQGPCRPLLEGVQRALAAHSDRLAIGVAQCSYRGRGIRFIDVAIQHHRGIA